MPRRIDIGQVPLLCASPACWLQTISHRKQTEQTSPKPHLGWDIL